VENAEDGITGALKDEYNHCRFPNARIPSFAKDLQNTGGGGVEGVGLLPNYWTYSVHTRSYNGNRGTRFMYMKDVVEGSRTGR